MNRIEQVLVGAIQALTPTPRLCCALVCHEQLNHQYARSGMKRVDLVNHVADRATHGALPSCACGARLQLYTRGDGVTNGDGLEAFKCAGTICLEM